jgi:subtilisin family serine protease
MQIPIKTRLACLAAGLTMITAASANAQISTENIAAWQLLGPPMELGLPEIDPLASEARERGLVRVIVSLARPPDLSAEQINAALVSRLSSEFAAAASEIGIEMVETIANLPLTVLEVSEGQLSALIEAGLIAGVVADVPQPAALGDSIPLINADAATKLGADGKGQSIAILDTGVERGHTFFGGRVVAEACHSSNSATYGSQSVCPGGATTSTGVGSATPCGHPSCSHGTHVAGIAAGSGNNLRGVAPEADILAIQVFSLFTDTASGPTTCADIGTSSPCILTFTSDQIAGLQQVFDWRGNHRIAAANMSLGGGKYTSCDGDVRKPIIDQLRAADIATVIASGNDSLSDGVGSPGCITTALTVGNTTKGDAVASSSNSAAVVDLLAPGTRINSSIPGGGFASKTGTSMASPHIAGAVAALKSVRNDLTIDEIEQALEASGVPITDPRNNLTRPRVDLEAAVRRF